MKRVDIEAIKAREKAASPGPWRRGDSMTRQSSDFNVSGSGEWPIFDSDSQRIGVLDGKPIKLNAEFVAHARQDIPALIAEVEALREAHEVLVRHWKKHNGHNCPEDKEVREALAKLPPLTERP